VSIWYCPVCGYAFDEAAGHPREGFPPGTPWSKVPDEWHCPDCGVRDKIDFVSDPPDVDSARSTASGQSAQPSRD
jgi:rubredoxin